MNEEKRPTKQRTILQINTTPEIFLSWLFSQQNEIRQIFNPAYRGVCRFGPFQRFSREGVEGRVIPKDNQNIPIYYVTFEAIQLAENRTKVIIEYHDNDCCEFLVNIIKANLANDWPESGVKGPKIKPIQETAHFVYPLEKRREIAKKYREDKSKNRTTSQAAFASRYGISDRTLRSYLREFPETET